ncbi:MAG: helix-turn-helix transcriptional regulator [Myxococcales bacterium]|nr:helix-turn-helix transcriptional regulator [Myxococcales bacterium]
MNGDQCRAARALLRWNVNELAARAEVNRTTILAFEAGQTEPRRATLKTLRAALEAGGVVFTNGDLPGVALERRRDTEPR